MSASPMLTQTLTVSRVLPEAAKDALAQPDASHLRADDFGWCGISFGHKLLLFKFPNLEDGHFELRTLALGFNAASADNRSLLSDWMVRRGPRSDSTYLFAASASGQIRFLSIVGNNLAEVDCSEHLDLDKEERCGALLCVSEGVCLVGTSAGKIFAVIYDKYTDVLRIRSVPLLHMVHGLLQSAGCALGFMESSEETVRTMFRTSGTRLERGGYQRCVFTLTDRRILALSATSGAGSEANLSVLASTEVREACLAQLRREELHDKLLIFTLNAVLVQDCVVSAEGSRGAANPVAIDGVGAIVAVLCASVLEEVAENEAPLVTYSLHLFRLDQSTGAFFSPGVALQKEGHFSFRSIPCRKRGEDGMCFRLPTPAPHLTSEASLRDLLAQPPVMCLEYGPAVGPQILHVGFSLAGQPPEVTTLCLESCQGFFSVECSGLQVPPDVLSSVRGFQAMRSKESVLVYDGEKAVDIRVQVKAGRTSDVQAPPRLQHTSEELVGEGAHGWATKYLAATIATTHIPEIEEMQNLASMCRKGLGAPLLQIAREAMELACSAICDCVPDALARSLTKIEATSFAAGLCRSIYPGGHQIPSRTLERKLELLEKLRSALLTAGLVLVTPGAPRLLQDFHARLEICTYLCHHLSSTAPEILAARQARITGDADLLLLGITRCVEDVMILSGTTLHDLGLSAADVFFSRASAVETGLRFVAERVLEETKNHPNATSSSHRTLVFSFLDLFSSALRVLTRSSVEQSRNDAPLVLLASMPIRVALAGVLEAATLVVPLSQSGQAVCAGDLDASFLDGMNARIRHLTELLCHSYSAAAAGEAADKETEARIKMSAVRALWVYHGNKDALALAQRLGHWLEVLNLCEIMDTCMGRPRKGGLPQGLEYLSEAVPRHRSLTVGPHGLCSASGLELPAFALQHLADRERWGAVLDFGRFVPSHLKRFLAERPRYRWIFELSCGEHAKAAQTLVHLAPVTGDLADEELHFSIARLAAAAAGDARQKDLAEGELRCTALRRSLLARNRDVTSERRAGGLVEEALVVVRTLPTKGATPDAVAFLLECLSVLAAAVRDLSGSLTGWPSPEESHELLLRFWHEVILLDFDLFQAMQRGRQGKAMVIPDDRVREELSKTHLSQLLFRHLHAGSGEACIDFKAYAHFLEHGKCELGTAVPKLLPLLESTAQIAADEARNFGYKSEPALEDAVDMEDGYEALE